MVLPKLGLGLSMVTTAGKFNAEMMPLAAERQCVGMSTHTIGPAFEQKNFGCQSVSLGIATVFGVPKVNNARHLCACIGA